MERVGGSGQLAVLGAQYRMAVLHVGTHYQVGCWGLAPPHCVATVEEEGWKLVNRRPVHVLLIHAAEDCVESNRGVRY